MNVFWFFDLEETIIDSWDNPVLCNYSLVSSFIKRNKIRDAHIFSAAIWNDHDKDIFKHELAEMLSIEFNVNFVSWISMEEVWKQTWWKTAKFDSVSDLLLSVGKNRLFEDWCINNLPENSHAILIDDSFGNTTHIDNNKNIIAQIIDVADLNCFGVLKEISINKFLNNQEELG